MRARAGEDRAAHGYLDRALGGGVGWLVALATVAATLASIAVLLFVLEHGGVRRARAQQVRTARAEVTITARAGSTKIPGSFLGLSTEYWALPLLERHTSVLERVLSALHARGAGPQILRVGGDSADCTFWEPTARRLPQWVFPLTPDWLRQARILVQRGGVRLILDLNLITATPGTAAQPGRSG